MLLKYQIGSVKVWCESIKLTVCESVKMCVKVCCESIKLCWRRQSSNLLRSRRFSLETVAQYLSRYILMVASIKTMAMVVMLMASSIAMAVICTFFQLASYSEGLGTARHLIQKLHLGCNELTLSRVAP